MKNLAIALVKAQKENIAIQEPHFVTVENPIAMMKDEHSIEGERFDKIATLTDGFTPPLLDYISRVLFKLRQP